MIYQVLDQHLSKKLLNRNFLLRQKLETMMKHINDQDTLIARLLNQKDCTPKENYMNSKEQQEHEICSSKGKNKMKEIYVTAKGTNPME